MHVACRYISSVTNERWWGCEPSPRILPQQPGRGRTVSTGWQCAPVGLRSLAPTGEHCRLVGKLVDFSALLVFLHSPHGSAAPLYEALQLCQVLEQSWVVLEGKEEGRDLSKCLHLCRQCSPRARETLCSIYPGYNSPSQGCKYCLGYPGHSPDRQKLNVAFSQSHYFQCYLKQSVALSVCFVWIGK